jgi:PAS domain S-box-containing protein
MNAREKTRGHLSLRKQLRLGQPLKEGGLQRPAILRYGAAVLAVALATLLRKCLDPLLGSVAPFSAYYLAIMLVARYSGLIPSILALAAGGLLASYLFIEPRGSLAITDLEHQVSLGLYAFVGVVIIWLNQALQNQIRKQSRIEGMLRDSERRFHNYFDQGLAGMAVTSLDKRWLEVNDRLCKILGRSREELLRTDWIALTHPDDVEPNLTLFNRLVAGEIDHFTLDKRFLRKDGSTLYATLHVRAFRREDGAIDHIVSLTEDITARKEAEEAMRQSEERYKGLVEASPDAVVMFDLEGKVLVASRQTWRLLGLSDSDELVGRSVFDYVAEEDRQRLAANMTRLIEAGLRRNTEYIVLRQDKARVPVEVSSAVIRDADGQPKAVTAVLRDITERKRAQEALERERQALWRMLQASDHERQTISYEIHDGLAQYLAAAIMQFETHDALRPNSPDQAEKAYKTAVSLVHQSHAETRHLVSKVRPPVIDEIGLETAISHLVHEQQQDGGPKIEFSSMVEFGRLPAFLENALYRIVQEALTNACRHSKSRRVAVSMTQEGQNLRLEVRDWGGGFDPESVEKGHFGLEGIRQRVRLLGGRLTVQSAPGSGTLVQVLLPIVERDGEG